MYSKSPLPIPNEVKSDVFLVIKRRLFSPYTRGQDATTSKKMGEEVGGVTSKR